MSSEEVVQRLEEHIAPHKSQKKLAGKVTSKGFIFKENLNLTGGQLLWTKGRITEKNGRTRLKLSFGVRGKELGFLIFWTLIVSAMSLLIYFSDVVQASLGVVISMALIVLIFGYSLVLVPFYFKRGYLAEYIDRIIKGKKKHLTEIPAKRQKEGDKLAEV